MGQIRIFNGPPKAFEFDQEDLVIDNINGDIYYKDWKGNLQKIIRSNDTATSLSINSLKVATEISSSNTITTNITASGNISASGTVIANNFQSDGQQQIAVADSFNITGSITSSGDVSASGTGSFTGGIDCIGNTPATGAFGYISASGDISASGTITALSGSFTNYQGDFLSITSEEQKIGDVFGNNTATFIRLSQSLGRMDVNCLNGTEKKIVLNAKDLIIDDENSTNTQRTRIQGHVTASGNISSSGTITAEHFHSSDDLTVTDNLLVGSLANGVALDKDTGITTTGIAGNITASGNISSSGNVIANFYDAKTSGTGYKLSGAKALFVDSGTIFGRPTTDTVIIGSTIQLGRNAITHVTASGNISSSGTGSFEEITTVSTGSFGHLFVNGTINIPVVGNDPAGIIQVNGVNYISGTTNDLNVGNTLKQLDLRGTSVIITGSISASGDISSSGGTVTAKQLTLDDASRVDIKFTNVGDEDHYIRKDGNFLRFRGHDDSTVLLELRNNTDGSNKTSFPNGNHGIGTNDPGEKLEVVGNISASGNIIANTGSFNLIEGGVF